MGFELLRPTWAPLLLLVPLLVLAAALAARASRRELAALVQPLQLGRFLPGRLPGRTELRYGLAALGLT